MPGKMARSDPRPSVRVTRGAGSGQHLASVLQEGRENANIDAGLGFIGKSRLKAFVGKEPPPTSLIDHRLCLMILAGLDCPVIRCLFFCWWERVGVGAKRCTSRSA